MEIAKFKDISRKLLLDAIISARNSHKKAFGDNREHDDLTAGIWLNDATSSVNTLKSIYHQDPDNERNEFDEFFHSFSVYKSELLRNISSGHSHQWTDIEYNKMIKSAKPLADLIDLDIDRFIER